MKILFASAINDSWTYIPEMIENFGRRGAEVDLFSIHDMPARLPLVARAALRFRELEEPTRVALMKRNLAGYGRRYDAVNIHFAAPVFRRLLRPLRRRTGRLVTSIWGSDFLRASPENLEHLGAILAASDRVTTNNPEVRDGLLSRFPGVDGKLRIVRFGLQSLDVIRDLQGRETQEESRRRLGLPLDKTIVALGYNGRPEQQHGIMIEALAALPQTLKAKVFALLPMTYGGEPAYAAALSADLTAAGIEHAIFDRRMDLDDVCRTRLVSDYAVNMQITDSFSASIQEHIMAGSTMIVGDWLPYGALEKLGAPLVRVRNAAEITAALAARGAARKTPQAGAAAKAVYDQSSWAATAESWLDLYRG